MFHVSHNGTQKVTQAGLRRRHQISFRRFLSLEGDGCAIADYLNMNAWELREYLSSLFLPGMSWKNYRLIWVVGHIVPLKYFDAFDRKQMSLAWNNYNLRPEWLEDNHDKSTSLILSMQGLQNLPECVSKNMLIAHVNQVLENRKTYFEKMP